MADEAVGGLAGLGGFVDGLSRFADSSAMNDILMGIALLDNGRKRPGGPQPIAQVMAPFLARGERMRDRDQEAEALGMALKSAGVPDAEVAKLRFNPTAAKIRLQGISEQKANDAIRSVGSPPGFGGGELAAPPPQAPAGGTGPRSDAGEAEAAPVRMVSGRGGGQPFRVNPEIRDGIAATANALGISPVDLATAISYETAGTFDPTKAGPRTQWGRHRGLIQFGEPQARQHGVDWNDPVGSQLGENGAVASYLRAAGVKPGMGLLDIYSAINAGRVGLYNRTDENNGGAPGTVRDKVERQMSGHRAKAERLFAEGSDVQPTAYAPTSAPAPGMMPATFERALGRRAGGGDIASAPMMAQGPAATMTDANPPQIDRSGPARVEAMPGDDPAELRREADQIERFNPEAARQLRARAEMAERRQRGASRPMATLDDAGQDTGSPLTPSDIAPRLDRRQMQAPPGAGSIPELAGVPMRVPAEADAPAPSPFQMPMQGGPMPTTGGPQVASAAPGAMPLPQPRPANLRSSPAAAPSRQVGDTTVPMMGDPATADNPRVLDFLRMEGEGRLGPPASAPRLATNAARPAPQASTTPGEPVVRPVTTQPLPAPTATPAAGSATPPGYDWRTAQATPEEFEAQQARARGEAPRVAQSGGAMPEPGSPQAMAQAQQVAPKTAEPPKGDPGQYREGSTTQKSLAQAQVQWGLRAIAAGSLAGDRGKGLVEQGKKVIDLASKWLEPTELDRQLASLPLSEAERQKYILGAIDKRPEAAQMAEYMQANPGMRQNVIDYRRAGAGSVTVNNAANPIVEGFSKQFVEQRESAAALPGMIRSLHEARAALDTQGGAFLGIGAEGRLNLAKVGALFGVVDPAKIANTETFRSAIGESVLNRAKALGANPTNTDREYIEAVQAGRITLDETSIRRIMDIQERIARQGIQRFNATSQRVLETMSKNPNVDPTALDITRALGTVTEPEPYKPPEKKSKPSQQGGGSKYKEGDVAINPETGEEIVFRNGKWVPRA